MAFLGKVISQALTYSFKGGPNFRALSLEEDPAVYARGGFHPVHLGDVLNDYKILRKLGYGRYSTVWLASNQKHKNFSSVKVLSAECYGAIKDLFELEILEYLRKADPKHPGYCHVSQLIDAFDLAGPNGNHKCLVFKPMAESLSTFPTIFQNHQIPTLILKRIISQLLQALDYAHSCGIIHTDIKPDNIMIEVKDQGYIDKYLEKCEPDPRFFDPKSHPSSIRSQPLLPGKFDDSTMGSILSPKIALIDWGAASWTSQHLREVIQPQLLRAPEVILQAPWGPAVDIWNLGCIAFELLGAKNLFDRRPSVHADTETKIHLQEIEDLFGRFPKKLLARGRRTARFFQKDGTIRNLGPLEPLTLEEHVRVLERSTITDFLHMLRCMMKILPEERIAAKELLN